jgi:hypothetical protein
MDVPHRSRWSSGLRARLGLWSLRWMTSSASLAWRVLCRPGRPSPGGRRCPGTSRPEHDKVAGTATGPGLERKPLRGAQGGHSTGLWRRFGARCPVPSWRGCAAGRVARPGRCHRSRRAVLRAAVGSRRCVDASLVGRIGRRRHLCPRSATLIPAGEGRGRRPGANGIPTSK